MSLHGHLPKLAPERYRGFAAVHWSMTVADRRTGWLTPLFHARFRELLVHMCVRHGVLCPMYCLMPDHMHLLLRGSTLDADQRKAVTFLRRYLNPLLVPARLQHEAHDHVLRPDEIEQGAFRAIAFYIAENPVRAGLVNRADEHAFTGAVVPGLPDLNVHGEGYWDVFWKHHGDLLRKSGWEG